MAISSLLQLRYRFRSKSSVTNFEPRIETWTSELHHTASTSLFLGCALLTSSTLLFGEPILCIVNDVNEKLFNTYCWSQVVFIRGDEAKKRHSYYQWVGIVFALQAIAFYLPHWLWKNSAESRRVKALSRSIANREQICDYLAGRRHANAQFAIKLCAKEVANLANVLLQGFLLDVLLEGRFVDYGLEAAQDFSATSERVFPNLGRCALNSVGPSGSIRNHDGLCVLAINVLNEKAFLVVWFWLVLLAAITAINVFWGFSLFASKALRRFRLSDGRNCLRESLIRIENAIEFGDFVLLDRLKSCLDAATFEQLVFQLEEKLSSSSCDQSLVTRRRHQV